MLYWCALVLIICTLMVCACRMSFFLVLCCHSPHHHHYHHQYHFVPINKKDKYIEIYFILSWPGNMYTYYYNQKTIIVCVEDIFVGAHPLSLSLSLSLYKTKSEQKEDHHYASSCVWCGDVLIPDRNRRSHAATSCAVGQWILGRPYWAIYFLHVRRWRKKTHFSSLCSK